MYLAGDADNAGQLVGQSVLMDDVQQLHDISQKIEAGSKLIKDWVLANNGQIVSIGGDEITAILDPSLESQVEEIRSKYKELTGFSVTIGIGNTLSQAGKALIAGKLSGKDMLMRYSEETEEVLRQAHEAAQGGDATPDQQKMDDHYISHISDEEDDQEMPEEHSEESMMALPEHHNEEEEMPESEYDQEMPQDEDMQEESMNEEDMSQDSEQLPDDAFEEYSEEDIEDEDINREDAPESEFESEEPIHLDDENAQVDQNEEPSEKADEMMQEEGAPEDFEDPAMLEEGLADNQGAEELMQRIAANLDAFKQNREVIESMKESSPETYKSVLGLLYNMIELARMIDPEAVDSMQDEMPEEETSPEESMEEEAPEEMVEEDASLPKPNG